MLRIIGHYLSLSSGPQHFSEIKKQNVPFITDGLEEHTMLGSGCIVHYMRRCLTYAMMTTGQLKIPITYWETAPILCLIF